jgi:hypothetical protein
MRVHGIAFLHRGGGGASEGANPPPTPFYHGAAWGRMWHVVSTG